MQAQRSLTAFAMNSVLIRRFGSHFRPPVNKVAAIFTPDQKKLRSTKAHPSKPDGSVHTPFQRKADSARSAQRTADPSASDKQRHRATNPANSGAAPSQRTSSCSRSKEGGAAQPSATTPSKKTPKAPAVKKGRKVNNGIADR